MRRRKMKPGNRRVAMTVRMTPEQHESLVALAAFEGHTIASEIDLALTHHITAKACSPRVLMAR